jgi:hypothetical protein
MVPPAVGGTDVLWDSDDPGATEVRLKRWAIDQLRGDVERLVYPNGRPSIPEPEHPAAFEWPSVFKRGEVVRRRSEATMGVVLGVVDYSSDESPRYELHVDVARDGDPVGVECWDPWIAMASNDPDSIGEARRLGLRGLAGA